MNSKPSTHPAPIGILYARLAGKLLGVILIVIGILSAIGGTISFFAAFKACYFVVYGTLLSLPYMRLKETQWKWLFGSLSIASAGFVFVMIVSVILDYMAADARGERLGVPGLEGTLIFLALLQVPTVFFQRKPDLLG